MKKIVIMLFLVLSIKANESKISNAQFFASQSSIGKATYTSFAVAAACYCYDSDKIGKQALALTNNFRAQNGRGALKWNQYISNLAKIHSQDMGTGQVPFGHAGFNCRVSCFNRTARASGENVFQTSNATRDNIAQKAVTAWINSPGHRANLLGNFSTCGIGVYRTVNGVWYVTQIFALF